MTLDLGSTYQVNGFSYLPRQSGTNGMFKGYEIYVSADGQDWGTPVATGSSRTPPPSSGSTSPPRPAGIVKFVGTSSLNGAVFGSAAEFNVYGTH